MSNFTHYGVKNYLQSPIMSDGVEAALSQTETKKTFLENLITNLSINIISLTDDEIIFDLIGVDASIANALRRILLSEVATIAIETIYIEDNTSIIQDEVLSHRIGLIPILANPNKLEQFKTGEDETTLDTLVFRLEIECFAAKKANEEDINRKVYSNQLQWMPQGNQISLFPGFPFFFSYSYFITFFCSIIVEGVNPVHADILLAELRPGQRIALEAHAYKGIGKDHAKFSPVATAAYRLLPGNS